MLQRGKAAFFAALILILATILCVSFLVAVTMGSYKIAVADVYGVIANKMLHRAALPPHGVGKIHDIVWILRLPRLVLAALTGAGLSVCGCVMQAVVRNSLADPYILGISSGASFGATLAIMFGIGSALGSGGVGVCAFAGAVGAAVLVLLIANVKGRANPVKLLLTGMAVSAVNGAFSSFFIFLANDKDRNYNLTFWLMGGMGGASWGRLSLLFPLVLVCVFFFISQYRVLNLMLHGDETSITLGTDPGPFRHVYLCVVALMVGFIVASAGMIGFVGLVVPHAARMLAGSDHRKTLPVAALVGAILLVWADVLCRVIIPYTELPIGILVSIIGAPCFVYLMARRRYGFGGGRP